MGLGAVTHESVVVVDRVVVVLSVDVTVEVCVEALCVILSVVVILSSVVIRIGDLDEAAFELDAAMPCAFGLLARVRCLTYVCAHKLTASPRTFRCRFIRLNSNRTTHPTSYCAGAYKEYQCHQDPICDRSQSTDILTRLSLVFFSGRRSRVVLDLCSIRGPIAPFRRLRGRALCRLCLG